MNTTNVITNDKLNYRPVYKIGYTFEGRFFEYTLETSEEAKDILKLLKKKKNLRGLNLSEWEYNLVYDEYMYVKSMKYKYDRKGEVVICTEEI
jgi:hypothetical protein